MKTTEKVIIGTLAGAAAGLLAGILFAPESGEKTRKKIKRKADDVKRDLEDWKDKTVEKLETMKNSAQDYVANNK
ncbi:MAG: YtxH domain-containing protein [Bacteroidota bacterium]|nr:YtxH domain-containing protein [Bacteroidota bacterium]MDX5428357.1 YtxH domain-containing protein [Bacteroidota bacterium]MDX5447568.1 YtxH domain-containing protein [Bacteroidota bacterium]MDX5506130.1 YtxH domain-containing protein [Bacteroidota bacterium]